MFGLLPIPGGAVDFASPSLNALESQFPQNDMLGSLSCPGAQLHLLAPTEALEIGIPSKRYV
jgi:hypothetical protein